MAAVLLGQSHESLRSFVLVCDPKSSNGQVAATEEDASVAAGPGTDARLPGNSSLLQAAQLIRLSITGRSQASG
jgi:hypothetical protein